MRKVFGMLCCLFLFTASMCENEPLDNSILQNVSNEDCEQASTTTATTAQAYAEATESNYTEVCSAYKAALTTQIQSCGDSGGALQGLINSLGDCSTVNQTDCESIMQATSVAQSAFQNASAENSASLCLAYKTALQLQIQACGDSGGNLQLIVDALGDCSSANPTDCDTVKLAANAAQTAYANASAEDYSILCNAYKMALQLQIQACGDPNGSLASNINALGDCTLNGGGGNTDHHAFMTANIDGIQYNDMKPNGYLFFPQGVLVNDFFSRPDDDYILIQGTNGYRFPTVLDPTDREIDLRLPTTYWKEGTFTLYNADNDVFEGVCFYDFIRFDYPSNITKKDLVGEIIVSKFSLVEKVIQGTFEFEFMLLDRNDNSETGPFVVTGTFDYALDDEFFN